CWAKFYCSGGCNANNLQYAGGILNPHKLSCDLEKKRLECAIMIKAALA
ncbi:MAG: thioether cross-link-forming SCIFF peptide maturase, partial [Oscillospiraceae bacterium]